MFKILCSTLIGLAFSFSCFASVDPTGGAHMPCSHNPSDIEKKAAAKRTLASMFPQASIYETDSRSIDSGQDTRGR